MQPDGRTEIAAVACFAISFSSPYLGVLFLTPPVQYRCKTVARISFFGGLLLPKSTHGDRPVGSSCALWASFSA